MNLKYERRKWEARMLLRAERLGNKDTQKYFLMPVRVQVPRTEREIFIREVGWEAYEWQRR
jgi:hypothetical protein